MGEGKSAEAVVKWERMAVGRSAGDWIYFAKHFFGRRLYFVSGFTDVRMEAGEHEPYLKTTRSLCIRSSVQRRKERLAPSMLSERRSV